MLEFKNSKIFLSRWLLLVLISSFLAYPALAQEEIIYTKSFTEKIKKFGVSVAMPLENAWLHPTYLIQDGLGKYDLTVRTEDESVEIRYMFKNVTDKQSISNTPHAKFWMTCSTLATNNERAYIKMRDLHPDILEKYTNADWGMEADFVPKESILGYKKGKLIGIFKEEVGFFMTAIFYNHEIPDYLLFPVVINSNSTNTN